MASRIVTPAVSPFSADRPSKSVYEIIASQIIEQLEAGVVPWHKPWRTEWPANLLSQKPYRGLNVFLLASRGFGSKFWLTFNQARRLGGHIRKGERGQLITFWQIGRYQREDPETGQTESKKRILLRYYRVFNLEQTEGIANKLGLTFNGDRTPSLEECQRIVSEMPTCPRIEQDHRAWYRPSTDTIGIPSRQAFESPAEYYATLFHELVHSTGHPSRIGREGIEKLNVFGSELYSKEELIAEMGGAMLCGIAGIEQHTLENSAAYLQTWIDHLKSDSRLIISAASHAQKAADFVLGKSIASDAPDSSSTDESSEMAESTLKEAA